MDLEIQSMKKSGDVICCASVVILHAILIVYALTCGW